MNRWDARRADRQRGADGLGLLRTLPHRLESGLVLHDEGLSLGPTLLRRP